MSLSHCCHGEEISPTEAQSRVVAAPWKLTPNPTELTVLSPLSGSTRDQESSDCDSDSKLIQSFDSITKHSAWPIKSELVHFLMGWWLFTNWSVFLNWSHFVSSITSGSETTVSDVFIAGTELRFWLQSSFLLVDGAVAFRCLKIENPPSVQQSIRLEKPGLLLNMLS